MTELGGNKEENDYDFQSEEQGMKIRCGVCKGCVWKDGRRSEL